MEEFYIKAKPDAATLSQAFPEATAEELRVLVAAIRLSGARVTLEKLATEAATSLPRAKASLSLWESEGAILRTESESNVIDEFELSTPTVEAKRTAESIRAENLRSLHEEVARIIEKPALEREEITRITSLVTELALSPEYIITLASFLKEKREKSDKDTRLRVGNIVNQAKALTAKGIDTLEVLERHIELSEKDTRDERMIRSVLGIWGRSISKTIKEYFSKWTNEYCFGEEIISEAYDIASLNTTNSSPRYMDKVLTSWHEAGLKTVEECRNYDTSHLKQKADKRSAQRKPKTEPEKPRYGNFDPEAALEAAIKRSFSKNK